MGEWYRVVKRIRGKPYLYLQRTHRDGKRVITQSKYVGRVDDSSTPGSSLVGGVGLAIFGLEDEYGERRDSLWNRYVNAEPEKIGQLEPTKDSESDPDSSSDPPGEELA